MLTKHFRSELFNESDLIWGWSKSPFVINSIVFHFDDFNYGRRTANICFKIVIIINFMFCPNIIYCCSVQLDCSISYKESGIKINTINWNIAISCIYEWIKCCQKRQKSIDEWLILLRNIYFLIITIVKFQYNDQ
jgi:hypothetical protein